MTGFAIAGAFAAALRLALAVVPAAIALPAPAAAEVSARAADHGTYGRMVFDWRAPVRHTARLSGRSLTIRFDRPITRFYKYLSIQCYPYTLPCTGLIRI